MIFTIIDIETTGFSRHKDEILEVGYMQVNENLQVYRSGSLYFYRDEWMRADGGQRDLWYNEAQQVHKLTREFLQPYEKSFKSNLVTLYTLLENAIVVGKNNKGFDLPMIEQFFYRHVPELGAPRAFGQIDLQGVFTPKFREWYERRYHESTRKLGSLSELMEVINYTPEMILEGFRKDIPNGGDREFAHSALYDVYMTYLLLKHAVETNMLQIINKTGKSNEELQWEKTLQTIEGLEATVLEQGILDFSKFVFAVKECFVKYNINSDSVDYMRVWFDELNKLLLTDTFIQALSTLNEGVRGFTRVTNSYNFELRSFAYWMLELYVKTGDEVFIKIAKILYDYCKFIPKYVKEYTGEAFDFDVVQHKSSIVSTYLAYNMFKEKEFSRTPAVDVNDPEILRLFQMDRISFWKKAIPDTAILFGELCYGVISKNVNSIYGLFILLRERGGV